MYARGELIGLHSRPRRSRVAKSPASRDWAGKIVGIVGDRLVRMLRYDVASAVVLLEGLAYIAMYIRP